MERWLRDIENFLVASDRFEEETDGKNFDLVRKALDRMKPKKAIYSDKDAVMVCANCGKCVATVGWRKDVCECGQVMDWSE